MSGKIFSDSINIYQDQAKVIFEYFKQVSEKIVAEEERIEKEIAIKKESIVQFNSELSKSVTQKKIFFIGSAVAAIAGIILGIALGNTMLMAFLILAGVAGAVYGITFISKQKNLIANISDSEDKVKGFQKEHEEIFRDYKISKLGVGYIPIAAQIPFEGKSFIVDFTNTVDVQEFKLQTLKESTLFTATINDFENLLKEAPIVEQSSDVESVDTDHYSRSIQNVVYHDYFGNLNRNLKTASYCLNELDLTLVSLPVVMPGSEYSNYINEHATNDVQGSTVFELFDTQKNQADIEKFHELNEMKKSLERHSEQFEQVLKKLMVTIASSVQAITQMKIASTNQLVDQSNSILFKILKTSYNHYSPILESEEIDRIRNEKFNYQDSVENYQPFHLKQSSRVKFDLISNIWVAEDGSRTSFPFGIHQIHEEIIAPIVQNLMQETRLERLKIYNNIKDQKISYLNSWHQDTEEFYARNRSESNDLINIMRATLSEYIAAYNAMSALEKTEQSMANSSSFDSTVVAPIENQAEIILSFDAKSQEFQKIQTDFTEYMERLKEDIEIKAEKFEYIEYYDASLRDSTPKDYAVAGTKLHELDERRKQLIAVNPFFATNAKLSPEPSIEDITYEHMSINLNKIASSALNEIDEQENLG